MKFNERLKELRESAGLTQEIMADKLGVSTGAIGNWEAGTRFPKKAMQESIADFFNVDMDYLLCRTNEKPEFSLEELWIIENYRKADDWDQKTVRHVLWRYDEGGRNEN